MNKIDNKDFINGEDNNSNSRLSLPFRQKTELILLNEKGNILVEDHGNYLMFPWGGIDEWEINLKESAKRELYEETHLDIEGELEFLWSVSWKWFPEWANNEKRKKRYEKFQWEEVFFYVWKTKKLIESALMHEDTWEDKTGIPLVECSQKLVELANNDHPNTYPYRVVQLNWIRTLAILNNLTLPEHELFINNRM